MNTKENEQSAKQALVTYAIRRLAEQMGQPEAADDLLQPARTATLNYDAFLSLLQREAPEDQHGKPLVSLLSILTPTVDEKTLTSVLAARPLTLDHKTLCGSGEKDPDLWNSFAKEFQQLPSGENVYFESFSHLFYKYAWAVPSLLETGISLYEEFKALAALVHSSRLAPGPATSFLLVGGDISGIQSFIFTITSKAAAKGLRGRSFFIQLVGDAVVRSILRKLDLPYTNIIYAAGGNFLILAPDSMEVKGKLEKFAHDFNTRLLEEIRGELNLVLNWESIAAEAIGTPGVWREGLKKMRDTQVLTKKQPFNSVINNNWSHVFKVMDEGGGYFCAICQRNLSKDEGQSSESGSKEIFCNLCHSFSDLANDIRYDNLWMIVEPQKASSSVKENWSDLLVRLTGFRYRFAESKPERQTSNETLVYVLNEPNFLKNHGSGFRLLANITPRVTECDRQWAEIEQSKGNPAYADRLPEVGDVRDFDMLARDAEGIDRIGVLRMDVDYLGAVFSQWQPARALVGTSALSNAMDLFFSGRLNEIVRQNAMVTEQGENRLAAYIIYAGGDDLFIVGAWNKIVVLAEKIRDEFHQYTGCNPYLTISAGISLMERTKFPLYLAAEQADEALDNQAKALRWEVVKAQDGSFRWEEVNKNAIHFLGTVVGWDRWPQVRAMQEKLVELVNSDGKKVPRAMIQTVHTVYAQYKRDSKEYEKNQSTLENSRDVIRAYPMTHGRWTWLTAYQLARMKHQYKHAAEALQSLHEMIVNPEITPYTGLAARWAEYLTRGKG